MQSITRNREYAEIRHQEHLTLPLSPTKTSIFQLPIWIATAHRYDTVVDATLNTKFVSIVIHNDF